MSQGNPTELEIESYAQEYVAGDNPGDQVKAWRKAFPQSQASPEVQHSKASVMHSMEKVRERIEELSTDYKQKAVDKWDYTVDKALDELEEVRSAALSDAQYAPTVSAIMGKVKVAGLEVQKVDVTSGGKKLKSFGDFYGESESGA